MAIGDLERIFTAFERSGVRYLVVGVVAVVLHGHPRFTADLNLVLALDPANLRRAFDALGQLGYRPRAPVSLDEFLDPETRRRWIEEKGMTVSSLSSASIPTTESSRASRSRSTPPTDARCGRTCETWSSRSQACLT